MFFRHNGRRHTIRLGSISKADRLEFQQKVQRLVDTASAGLLPDAAQRQWLQTLAPDIHKKLAKSGLIPNRPVNTVGELLAWHRQWLKDRKRDEATLRHHDRVATHAIKHLGAGLPITSVTDRDAATLESWMLLHGHKNGGPLAVATVSREMARLKSIFAAAVGEGWLAVNPFRHVQRPGEVNTDRDEYVPWNVVKRLIEASPTAEFRLLLAMVRLTGLRCPSEIQDLRWSAVLWDLRIINVVKHKTKARDVPIFAELAPYLSEWWEASPEGEAMFPSMQGRTGTAIRNRLESVCRIAKIPMLNKPWVNMRASAERDMFRAMPLDQAAAILGHSPETALRHYNRVAKELRAIAEGRALHFPDLSWGVKQNAKRRRSSQGLAKPDLSS